MDKIESSFIETGLIDSNLVDKFKSFYDGRPVIVTGGASFIGSLLVDCLLSLNANVKVIDDLSSGLISNLNSLNKLDFVKGDLRYLDVAKKEITDSATVFHLAAVHGGRGFIETYKSEMLANFSIDNNVYESAKQNRVQNLVHASSACAYPTNLQANSSNRNLLAEFQASMNNPDSSFADGVYGWTKLIGEFQLENFTEKTSLVGRSARIFTAYGERENESHAAIALIAKALLNANPFPIWGDGNQTRNFTYVADTVTGLLLLGTDVEGQKFDVFNIGSSSHIKVIDFVMEIFNQINWRPAELSFQLDKPVGVASRASDNLKIKQKFNWEPNFSIANGLNRTINWYSNLANKPKNLNELEARLLSR